MILDGRFCNGRTVTWVIVAMMMTGVTVQAQTVRLGPLKLNLGVTAGAEFTDNVNLSNTNRQSDVTLTIGPVLSGGIALPFSGGEQFTLSLSATYSKSLTGRKEDSFGAPINAALILPLRIASWTVVMGDTFGFSNDPLETTFSFNRSKTVQYSNTALASATRQFGRFATTYAIQRTDIWAPDDPDVETTTHQLSFTPAYYFRENYSVFLRNTVGFNHLASSTQPDSVGYSTELGLSGQITPQLVGSVSLGYSHSTIEAIGTNSESNVDGISSTIALSYAHPLRPNTSHSLSFFRSPGVTAVLKDTAITEVTGITYTIAHRLSRQITLAPSLTYTHLEAIGGTSNEKSDIIQVGIGLSRAFTRHLSGSVGYRFQIRDSNLVDGSYYVNTVNANLSYMF